MKVQNDIQISFKIIYLILLLDNCKRDLLLYNLITKLNNQFSYDVGCFCIYFLNLIILEPYEAIFLDAGIPHAYLEGGKYLFLYKLVVYNRNLFLTFGDL